MHLITISHFISFCYPVCSVELPSHVLQTSDLVHLQGDRGPSGASGPPGDIGIGFPGAKVPLLHFITKKKITWNPQITWLPKCILNTTMNYLVVYSLLSPEKLFDKITPLIKLKL